MSATATSTTQLYQNIGRQLRNVADYSYPDGTVPTDETDAKLGRLIAGMIGAAVKSAIPGRQTSAQIKALQQQAQQAFARKLARKYRTLK